jgi:hypothetical protein
MSLLPHPGWTFKGRSYKTVNGLLTALAKDAKAVSIGMVSPEHTITAWGPDRYTVAAVYDVTPPKPGVAQAITRRAA